MSFCTHTHAHSRKKINSFFSFLCAGKPGFDTCSGDAGGALTYCGLQIGVLTFNSDACDGSTPSVFTDIAHPKVRAFIRDKTGI